MSINILVNLRIIEGTFQLLRKTLLRVLLMTKYMVYTKLLQRALFEVFITVLEAMGVLFCPKMLIKFSIQMFRRLIVHGLFLLIMIQAGNGKKFLEMIKQQ